MIPLYTKEEFTAAKSQELLSLQCLYCTKTFCREKHYVQKFLKPNNSMTGDFCTRSCKGKYTSKNKNVVCRCVECGVSITKLLNQFKKSKNHFCGYSCSATYNNKHKKHGTRRSKIEVWLEEQLTLLYPDIEILFNQKEAIGSELDIHLPSINKAIEINGIFHYKPIYGDVKWKQTQENDKKKVAACTKHDIELMVIDISSMIHFKSKKAQKYLDTICAFVGE